MGNFTNDQQASQRRLRDALGSFPTGVAIVTALGQRGTPVGMTINSFCSVSLKPALVSFCVDNSAASYRDFLTCPGFTISILNNDQHDVAKIFASRGADKFAALPGYNDTDSNGYGGFAPAIPGASAVFECRNYRRLTLGDHLMIVGKVVHFNHQARHPLAFFKGKFHQLLTNDFLPQPEPATALAV